MTEIDILADNIMQQGSLELQAFCDQKKRSVILQEVEDRLCDIATRAAFRAAYVGQRCGHGCGDQGHEKAAKVAAKSIKRVRKAMGYSYP